MEINRNDEKKIIEIWLTNQDQQDPEIQTTTNELIAYWYRQNYLPVIYRSGIEDLRENLLPLLKHNRKCSAQKAMIS